MKRLKHTPSHVIHVNSLVFDAMGASDWIEFIIVHRHFFLSFFLPFDFWFFSVPIRLIRSTLIADTVHIITHNLVSVCERKRARVHIRSEILMNESDALFQFIFKWFMFVNIFVSNIQMPSFCWFDYNKEKMHIGIPKESGHETKISLLWKRKKCHSHWLRRSSSCWRNIAVNRTCPELVEVVQTKWTKWNKYVNLWPSIGFVSSNIELVEYALICLDWIDWILCASSSSFTLNPFSCMEDVLVKDTLKESTAIETLTFPRTDINALGVACSDQFLCDCHIRFWIKQTTKQSVQKRQHFFSLHVFFVEWKHQTERLPKIRRYSKQICCYSPK